ncbi:MAG TPA: hypothetical protein VKD22_18110 [Ramlibacter sp.]|nr:hypothetical protein [Ramlibacter sp.]
MTARTTFVSRAIRLLPAPLLAALDAWSYRIAQRHAQMRREAGERRAQLAKLARQGSGA